jgi:hypothetical protein
VRQHVILEEGRWVSPEVLFDAGERFTGVRRREIGEHLH